MGKVIREDLTYLGIDYQFKLLNQILTDKKFANSILEILNPNYFKDQYLRIIAGTIIDAKQNSEVILDFPSLEYRLLEQLNNELQQRAAINTLRKIQETSLNDTFNVQLTAMKFCKQQELKKSIVEINKIIEKGDVDGYEECARILRKALEHGEEKDDGLGVFDNIDDVLLDDFRKPIPTGIEGLDEIMDGGLSKGELAVILAPFGVGKTTMITKIANTAMNYGYNVLQIFFEDNQKVIQRKHLSCWSGHKLNDLSLHKDELLEIVESKKKEKGVLKLKKFSSDGTTIPIIRNYIRKLIANGFRPDLVLVDYIDCVEPSKKFDDVNVGEGSVMRQFESLLSEFDMAGWTAIQGNRSSIKADVVEADQMGGSIKKAQIAHFVVSIAKTLDQKEAGTATMAILKSRFGESGLVFTDIRFDNARIQIDMGDNTGGRTYSEHKDDKGKKQQVLVNGLLNDIQKNKNQILTPFLKSIGVDDEQ
jgi:replicative DNA helicase